VDVNNRAGEKKDKNQKCKEIDCIVNTGNKWSEKNKKINLK